MQITRGSVEKYMAEAYQILPDMRWVDDTYLFDVDLNHLSAQDRAWIWFTLPLRGKAVIDI